MTRKLHMLFPWLPYPVVMTAVFVLFGWLQFLGASLIASTYIPVLFAAALVTWIELELPHRPEWRPPGGEDRRVAVSRE